MPARLQTWLLFGNRSHFLSQKRFPAHSTSDFFHPLVPPIIRSLSHPACGISYPPAYAEVVFNVWFCLLFFRVINVNCSDKTCLVILDKYFIFMIVFKTHPSVRNRYMAVQLLGWRVAWMLLTLSFKRHRVISKFSSNRIPLPFLFIFFSQFSCPLCHNTEAHFVETHKHAGGLRQQLSFSFLNVWGCSPLGSRKQGPVPSLKNCFRALPTFWRSPVTLSTYC